MKKFTESDYRKRTEISSTHARTLTEMSAWLPFLADLTQRSVLLFAAEPTKELVWITAQAVPAVGRESGFGDVGEHFLLSREQVLSHVLHTGKPVSGRRETEIGTTLAVDVFPLHDNAGRTFAALGFVGAAEHVPADLLAAAWRLSGLPYPEAAADTPEAGLQDGILLFSESGRLIYCNELGGYWQNLREREESGPRLRLDDSHDIDVVRQAKEERIPVSDEAILGKRLFWRRALPIPAAGKPAGVLLLVRDVTLLREKERELFVKNVVIQEVHHRVKNNLQTVAGLLRLQSRRSTPEVREALREAERRIAAIAAIHDILAQQVTDAVRLPEMLTLLAGQMRQEWASAVRIETDVAADPGPISSDRAVALGMAVHELVQNACEHGTAAGETTVRLLAEVRDGELVIRVTNDGTALPADFSPANYRLGLQIVANLVRINLGGRFRLQNTAGGVCAECRLPLEE
ncbi:MAG: histidine kinase N-terminal domain-containing protein [Veillonellaceae bacterium]|nr:histidine kinase N-terminal domain-containing protein [Veillonellaceae bacterium]